MFIQTETKQYTSSPIHEGALSCVSDLSVNINW